MTKPKYATAEERQAALSLQASQQMRAQWEQKRSDSGQAGPGYYGCHRRVRKIRGRAGDQPCADCGKPARHWAHIHDTDPADPRNYQAMCQACHWQYDGVGAKVSASVTAEEASARAFKAWETKRKKAADVASDPARPRD